MWDRAVVLMLCVFTTDFPPSETFLGSHVLFNLIRALSFHSPVWIKDVLVNFLNRSLYNWRSSVVTKPDDSEGLSPNKISRPRPSFPLPLTFTLDQACKWSLPSCGTRFNPGHRDLRGLYWMDGLINMGGSACFAAWGASASSASLQSFLCCSSNTCILAVKVIYSTTFIILVRWLLMTLVCVCERSMLAVLKGSKAAFRVQKVQIFLIWNSKSIDCVALPKQMLFSSSPPSITMEPLACLSSTSPFSSSLTALLALTNLMDLDCLNVTSPASFFQSNEESAARGGLLGAGW